MTEAHRRAGPSDGESPETDNRLHSAVVAVTGHDFTSGNRIEVLHNGVEIFPAMLDAIRSARHTIEFVTFVYWKGDIAVEFADALSERSREGVRVRVVLDGWGSIPMDQRLVDRMRRAGVLVERFRPPARWKLWEADHRTHRKILVVDNQVAFTGGVGIAEEWTGDAADPSEWRDTHFRVEGPVVAGLRAAFLTDWRDVGRTIEPHDLDIAAESRPGSVKAAAIDGSAQIGFNDAERLLEAVLGGALEEVLLQTPYFNPTARITEVLRDALRRRVKVEIMLPGPHIDKRISQAVSADSVRPLVAEGALVWEYQPTMFHVKSVLVDGHFSIVGSVNVNRRSVAKDEEVALAILDRDITHRLRDQFESDKQRCEPHNPHVDERGKVEALAGRLMKPFHKEL